MAFDDPDLGFDSPWVYSMILSLPCLLSDQEDGGFALLFFQLILITGTHKTAQASLPPFIISHMNSGVSQGCRKPSPMVDTQLYKTFTLLMQIPALHLWLAREIYHSCGSSGYRQNCWELLEMPFSSLKYSLSAGLWSLYDLSTPAALAGLALETKGRFS